MFSSVRCGLQAIEAPAFCAILPDDMPFVQPSTIAAVLAEATGQQHTAVPSLDGHRGHPVVLTPACRARLAGAPADARLDHELGDEDVAIVEVADPGVRRDVDRP
jgi:CTP:molybdopterin cytidylyltransferase MocA